MRGTARVCAALALAPAVLAAQRASDPGSQPATAEVRCVDEPPDAARPPYGCFNVGHRTGLTFADTLVVWRLYRFATRAAAEAARSPGGLVAEEAGTAWLSELAAAGAASAAPAGGTLVAASPPLVLPPAPGGAGGYAASLAYAVFRPGMRSRPHVHAGPEAFYVLAGAQCVETPGGVVRTAAGQAAALPAGTPMALAATGGVERRAFALVLRDARRPQAEPTPWRPTGACAGS